MTEPAVTIVDDTTFMTTAAYEEIFRIAKEAAQALGGRQITADANAGTIQYKYKYGINPGGIKVNIQFRRSQNNQTEVVVRGGVGGAFDTTGVGKARGISVLNEIIKRIESTPTEALSENVSTRMDTELTNSVAKNAPIIGSMGTSHRGKSKTTAALLAFILGGVGAHRFYLGTWGWGVIYCALLICSVSGLVFPYLGLVLGVAECLRFVSMKQSTFDSKYNYRAVSMFTF